MSVTWRVRGSGMRKAGLGEKSLNPCLLTSST